MKNSLLAVALLIAIPLLPDHQSAETITVGLPLPAHIPPPKGPLTLLFVGDVLLHQPQHVQALRHPQGHQSLWPALQSRIEAADVAYANLEGPIAPGTAGLGRAVTDPGLVFDKYVYTSYPMFNYHRHLADDLKSTGFDVVSTANNHSLDRGAIGVDRTIEQLNRAGLAFTGTRTTAQASNNHPAWSTRLSTKGWTISYVACAQHTNGIADSRRQVLSCGPEVLDIIKREKQDPNVDLVVVTPHWGDEYQPRPNAYQKQTAQKMVDAGADAIIGSHPHVIQPVTWMYRGEQRIPVAYSLGNFVSNQFHRQDTQKELLVELSVVPNPSSFSIYMETVGLRMTRGGSYQVVEDPSITVPEM